MSESLEGKRLIVTGAASGIGRASAKLFAARGARVIAADLSEAVHDVVEEIRSAGGEALSVQADLAAEDKVTATIATAAEAFGGLDGIYANAGISGGPATLDELTPERFERILQVNLLGPFLAIKHAAPVLVEGGGGSIVCTASVAGLRANAGGVDYSASKAGVVSLVQTCAYQLYGKGVRVNAICPGLIETGMTQPVFDRARAQGAENRIGQINPTARAGQPEEIAAVAAFLLSDAASYVNGQAIAVDGGLSASHPWVFPRR